MIRLTAADRPRTSRLRCIDAKPFPAWRLPKGMTNARDSAIENSIESCEKWEWFGGGLVVVGVIAELAIAMYHPPYDSFLEQWGSSLGNGLVALGVAMEIKFGQMSGVRQTELRRRSDDRLAEAKLALARVTTPRAELLTNAALETIAGKLTQFAGTKFDTGLAASSGEQADFLWRLEEALAPVPQGLEGRPNAGWIEIAWGFERQGMGAQVLYRGQRPVSGSVAAQNVELHLHPDFRDNLLPAATALVSALEDVGIEAKVAAFNTHSSNDDAIHILIGEKQ